MVIWSFVIDNIILFSVFNPLRIVTLHLDDLPLHIVVHVLQEARTKYRFIVSTTSTQMETIAHDRKRSIRKAREYYRVFVDAKLVRSIYYNCI